MRKLRRENTTAGPLQTLGKRVLLLSYVKRA